MEFLEVQDILLLHADQIDLYGGDYGVRDAGLLESAASQARATFGGEFLHADIFEMAAAYLFHIVQNHPFVDGNKRAGATAALVFLDLNGVAIRLPKGALYDLTMSVATGQAGKKEVAEFLRERGRKVTDESGPDL
jgi:death-on-curing protein